MKTKQTDPMELIKAGALVVVNNSGGKDSQAMLIMLRKFVPASQLVVVHQNLDEAHWPGTQDKAREISSGLEFHVVKSHLTLFSMVERRGMFPSPSQPLCKSTLKRDPTEKLIKRIMKERGAELAINCLGIRADESSKRGKMPSWSPNKRLSTTGLRIKRTVFNWFPIFSWTKIDVFAAIAAAGQVPHYAYSFASRLSCAFCIMGNRADIKAAAEHLPDLYRRYVELEKKLGFTLKNGCTLPEFIAGKGKDEKEENDEPCDSMDIELVSQEVA